MSAVIVIPTYNESENIEKLLAEVFRQESSLQVVVIDDNSPDKTWQIVEKLAASQYKGRLHLIKRAGKLGLGTAYIEGFKWAIKREYDYIFEMDADFSHNPIYLKDFLQAIKENDLVIGSRYIAGGGVKNWGWLRKLISRGGSLYSKVILGAGIKDLTGGYKCFRRETLEKLEPGMLKSNGYSFQIEMNYRAWLNKFKIVEIPIIFDDRTFGKSKMSKKIFIEALKMVWRLRFNKNKIVRGEW